MGMPTICGGLFVWNKRPGVFSTQGVGFGACLNIPKQTKNRWEISGKNNGRVLEKSIDQ